VSIKKHVIAVIVTKRTQIETAIRTGSDFRNKSKWDGVEGSKVHGDHNEQSNRSSGPRLQEKDGDEASASNQLGDKVEEFGAHDFEECRLNEGIQKLDASKNGTSVVSPRQSKLNRCEIVKINLSLRETAEMTYCSSSFVVVEQIVSNIRRHVNHLRGVGTPRKEV
jgi:hypothetical protein